MVLGLLVRKQVRKMSLNFKIKLYAVADESSRPELLSPFYCQLGDTYAELRLRLEKGGCVDWHFQFWDFDEQCCIRRKFEAMNPVCERVYVIPDEEDDIGRISKRRRLDNIGDTGSNDFVAPSQLEFPDVDSEELIHDVALPL